MIYNCNSKKSYISIVLYPDPPQRIREGSGNKTSITISEPDRAQYMTTSCTDSLHTLIICNLRIPVLLYSPLLPLVNSLLRVFEWVDLMMFSMAWPWPLCFLRLLTFCGFGCGKPLWICTNCILEKWWTPYWTEHFFEKKKRDLGQNKST